MISRKKILNSIFLVGGIILAFLPFIYGIYIVLTYQDAKISNLSMGYEKNARVITTDKIPMNASQIFVCGTLETSQAKYLSATLHSLDEKEYLGGVPPSHQFNPGKFCEEVELVAPITTGTYKLIVISQHERIGEVVFQIRSTIKH